MTRRRKLLLAAVALAGLLVVSVTTLVAWLALTERGLVRLVSTLESLDVVEIRIEGARGRLAGPLHVDAVDLRAGRVAVAASGVDLDWEVMALLLGRLDVDRLDAASVRVAIGQRTQPPDDKPPRFMPQWLSLGLGELRVGELELGLPNDTWLRYRDVSASGRITHVRIELDEAAVDAGAWTAVGSVGLVARQPLRLRGELAWKVRGEPGLAGSLRAKGDLARLEVAAAMHAPVPATAAAVLAGLDTSLRWEARVESRGLDLSHWSGHPPFGPLVTRLEGGGTLHTIELKGNVAGEGLPDGGLDLEARLQRNGEALVLEPVQLATRDGSTRLVTRGQVRLGEEPGLDLRSEWTGLAWPLTGPPTVSSGRGWLEIAGSRDFEFTTDAAVAAPGLPATSIAATGRIDPTGITIRESRLAGAAGRAQASGFFGFRPDPPWSIEASVQQLDLARFRPGFDSALTFDLSGSGTGFGAGAAWAARLGPVNGSLRGYPVTGQAFVVAQPGRFEFHEVDFLVGPARVRVDGHLGQDASLTADLEVPDLAKLVPDAGGRLVASAHLRPAGEPLADRPNLRVDLSVQGRDLRHGDQHAAVLSADADIDLSNRETSWVRLRAAGLVVGGQQFASGRLSLDGFAHEHDLDLRVGAGDRAVSLVGTGRFQEGTYALTGDRIQSDMPALHPYQLEAPMQLVLRRDAARLSETCFVYAPRRICVAGEWSPQQGWLASLGVASFPIEALRLDLPRRPGYRGRLDVLVHAAGRPGMPWTAEADGALVDASLEYVTPSGRMENLDLGTTRLRLESLPDRHALFVTTEDSDALQLRAEATIERADDVPVSASPLRGAVQLSTTRLGLLPLLVPEIDRAEGELQADLTLGGTPGALLTGGTLLLENGELDLYRTNLQLRSLRARVALQERGLTLESGGQAGPGTFRTEGAIDWTGRVLRGEIRLTGDRLLVADVPEARVEASPDLIFSMDDRDIAVKGSVTIPTARIEPRQLVGATLPSTDARIIGPGAPDTDDDAGYRVRTDVRLTLGQDVRIDAFGLKGRLEGSVLAQTRPEEVATASGELEIEDGKYDAYSKELEVERGRLLFAGGPVADPGVDLRASKKVPGYEVGVIARGRLRKPELSLYSDPSMPQSQIASLLLVGRRLDHLDTGERNALGGSRQGMVAEGGALLAGQLGRYVGIDEISLESESEEESSLVIGKFLSPRLYVSYGISLTDAINTFKLRYTIGDRWVITGESGQEASADVEYTIDR